MARPQPTLLLRDDDPGQEFLNLVSSPFNTALSTKAFWSSLGYSLAAATLCFLFFLFLRPYNGTVYAPRLQQADGKHAPPPLEKGVLGWVQPLVKTKEQVLVDKIGVDGALFLRFTKMCRNILVVLSIIGCGVYIPLNLVQNAQNNNGAKSNVFMNLTPLGVWGEACWAHVIVSYAFDIVICFFVWRSYRVVTRLRRDYFESPEYQASLHSRTLMVTDIPEPFRTDEGVARIVDEVDPVGDPSAVIARSIKRLPELIEEHDENVRELEGILAKYLKNPDKLPSKRPMCKNKQKTKVDAIDYLTARIEILKAEIADERKKVKDMEALSYGFASYQSIMNAHEVAFAAKKKHPHGTTVRLAPKPNDLIWENLPLSRGTRRRRGFAHHLWVTLLTVVWTVPNALIAVFLANLQHLGALWPDFQTELYRDPKLWGAIQGLLAPMVTTLFYMLLPVIFRRLSAYSGDISRTSRERHVTHKLFAFFLFNNLIVFSLFSTAWGYAAGIIEAQKETDVWTALKSSHPFGDVMTAFCQVSPFWLNYLLQRNFGAALDLSQLVKLCKGWLSRKLFSPSPRELVELSAPAPFDYAGYYNNFLFYFSISMVFAPFQPLVLPVTALYFTLDSYLKKYLLLYVFITKHESGGSFWRLLVNRILVVALLANVVTTLFIIARMSSILQVILMIPLILVLGGAKWYFKRTFDDDQHFYSTRTQKGLEETIQKSGKRERVGVRFGHPALYKKLMVPMVHARAQHMLAQVCRGHLDSGLDEATDYSDTFKLQRMSTHAPGQAADKAALAPFEIVNESEMDYEHFRNRAEFREQFGGDAMSEMSRPGTASSMRPSRPGSSDSSRDHPFGADRSAAPDAEGSTYPAGYHAPLETFRPSPLSRRQSAETGNYLAPTPGATGDFSEANLLGGAAPLGRTDSDMSSQHRARKY
ncbi:putative DUF221 domain protein [Xylariomycetidae sp. FL0641]|nr:putative DUF221 domain protein [Xylariomycetidae sp. FL0641]